VKRVLLDENLPRLLKRELPCFEVRTVAEVRPERLPEASREAPGDLPCYCFWNFKDTEFMQ
jgi:hypothetical protein